MRNFDVLTRKKIREFQKALVRLRARDIWSPVTGGCASLEITNGGEGWHLHAHILLDARFIDIKRVAVEWGELIGQEFGICLIKDVRGASYAEEVAKYVAKGSEIAKWDGNQILEFVNAIKGIRFFFAFGSLFKMGKQIKAELALKDKDDKTCDCGCTEFCYETEVDAVLREIRENSGDRKSMRYRAKAMPCT